MGDLPALVTKKRREVFLKVLARRGVVIEAARAAGYPDSNTLYVARKSDEDFAEAWDNALLASADILEEAAWTRAVDGVNKPVFFKGEVVGHETQYSDALLGQMLAARKKEYRKTANTSVDVDLTVSAKVGIAVIPMVAADPGAWEDQARKVHDNQKQLPAFIEPDANVVDAEFEEVGDKKQPAPQAQRTLERG